MSETWDWADVAAVGVMARDCPAVGCGEVAPQDPEYDATGHVQCIMQARGDVVAFERYYTAAGIRYGASL